MPLIGVDVGTSGCKCVIYNTDGGISGCSYSEYSQETHTGGYVELDPEMVWRHVAKTIAQAAKDIRFEGPAALSVSSFGEAGVALDSKGRVLCNSLMYTDPRGQEELHDITGIVSPDEIMEITGLPAHSMYTLPKLLWLKRNRRDFFEHIWKFLLYEDFISYRLCGETAIDYSLASRTMAFDVVNKRWSDRMLDVLDVKETFFANPCQAGTPVGIVLPNVAAELGLPHGTIVAAGGHDQACAALGAGVLDDGRAVNGMGTADCITTVFDRPVRNSVMLSNNFNCEPFLLPDKYISLSFTFTGGALLKWYRNCFGADYTKRAHADNVSVYALMDREIPPEPTNLLVLPHFDGAGTPHMDPASTGAIIGLTMETTPSHIYKSLLEGVAYEMRLNLEYMDRAGISIDELTAVGGGSSSREWLQIKADIFNRPIRTLSVGEAGTLGAAMLAGAAAGVFDSCAQAAGRLISEKERFLPDADRAAQYDILYGRYKKLYTSVKNICSDM